VLRTGRGEPATVVVHGLAGSIDDTRPFASGVTGTRWFVHLRGHGGTGSPDTPWTYAGLALEVAAVAAATGASRGVGASMGAGALLSLAVSEPGRLDRLVLVLPASVDRAGAGRTPSAAHAIADAIDGEDLGALTTLLAEELPQPPDAAMLAWVGRRSRRLLGGAVSRGFRELMLDAPVADRHALAAVDVPVLVIGAEGDPVHPAQVARELAEALPLGRLLVFPPGGLLWAHRAALREEISGFLSG